MTEPLSHTFRELFFTQLFVYVCVCVHMHVHCETHPKFSFPFLSPNFLSTVLFALLILTHWATGDPDLKCLSVDETIVILFWSVSKVVAFVISVEDSSWKLLFWVIIQWVVVIPYWHHHCSLHNNSEESSFHLLHGRSLKSRKTTVVSLW